MASVKQEIPTTTVALTEMIRQQLSVPIPQEALRVVDKGRRGSWTYADVDYLEQRLAEVDPDYSLDFRSFEDTMVCAIRLLGVLRSATAGIERPRENAERHTQVTKAEAAAFRRACAKFGLGAELWAKEPTHQQEQQAPRREYAPTQNQRNGSGKKGPTDPQRKFASNLGMTDAEIAALDWGGTRDNPKEGGQMLDALAAAQKKDSETYNSDKRKWVKQALKRIAPHVLNEQAPSMQDFYDDFEMDEDD